MHESQVGQYAYGLWGLVIINVGLFIGFLFSFAKPTTKVEWRSLGLFSSFIVALFVEMYGFPLTIYLLTSWLGSRYPVANPFSHENGHLLGIFFGIRSDHGTVLHLLSNLLIFGGAILIAQGWNVIHQNAGKVAMAGSYRYVRHPQYIGFIAIIAGFLIQWPTLITILMAPVLIIRYILLAKKEEAYMLQHYPKEYGVYMQKVPAWLPKLLPLERVS